MYIVNIDYCYGASSIKTYATYDKAKKAYNQAIENPEVTYCSVIGKDGNKLMEYAIDLR